MILLENDPVPVPSVVIVDRATVGLGLVLQHTPRAVTVRPPSLDMLPPLTAVVVVTPVMLVLVTVGNAAEVKVSCVA